MESQKLVNWIQVATGIAVVVGLGLVVWDLRQIKIHARVQVGAELAVLSH